MNQWSNEYIGSMMVTIGFSFFIWCLLFCSLLLPPFQSLEYVSAFTDIFEQKHIYRSDGVWNYTFLEVLEQKRIYLTYTFNNINLNFDIWVLCTMFVIACLLSPFSGIYILTGVDCLEEMISEIWCHYYSLLFDAAVLCFQCLSFLSGFVPFCDRTDSKCRIWKMLIPDRWKMADVDDDVLSSCTS